MGDAEALSDAFFHPVSEASESDQREEPEEIYRICT